MNKKELTRSYARNLSELRKVINSLCFIPNAARDEFDGLNHKILKQLSTEVDREKLIRILQSELIVNYGLFADEFDAAGMAASTIDWWNAES